jgi:alpha-glucuronidase
VTSNGESLVGYTMPMGLNLLCDFGHYKPSPAKRAGYHKADNEGLGYNRTRNGSGYVSQYHPEVESVYNDIDKTPLDYLLWFHHVPWHYELTSGRDLWQELNFRYDRGVAYVDGMIDIWKTLDGKIDVVRYESVAKKLKDEQAHSRTWRKACLSYFAGFVNTSKEAEQGSKGDDR